MLLYRASPPSGSGEVVANKIFIHTLTIFSGITTTGHTVGGTGIVILYLLTGRTALPIHFVHAKIWT